jgi:hypothetical protein
MRDVAGDATDPLERAQSEQDHDPAQYHERKHDPAPDQHLDEDQLMKRLIDVAKRDRDH